jgi:FKBP-type peptidyl-prolyl cis-trans isomerase FkpA
MKKTIVFALLSIFLLFNSCSKEDSGCIQNPVSAEKAGMIKFCTDNGIAYTEHSSGLLYQIINSGSGTVPTQDSRVFMFYTGKLMNGTTFEYQPDPTKTGWALKQLIEGWRIGVPLIQKGGKIKLVIPSSLAYGCTATASIPGNSPLYFEIGLTDVQ